MLCSSQTAMMSRATETASPVRNSAKTQSGSRSLMMRAAMIAPIRTATSTIQAARAAIGFG